MGQRILLSLILTLSAFPLAGSAQSKEQRDTSTVRVRYMVNELGPVVGFYTKHLGFQMKQQAPPNFAMLSRGNLGLVLSTPFGPGGAAKPMPEGRKAEPGGWIRININVDDLPAEVAGLSQTPVTLPQRHHTRAWRFGDHIGRPIGDPIELFPTCTLNVQSACSENLAPRRFYAD